MTRRDFKSLRDELKAALRDVEYAKEDMEFARERVTTAKQNLRFFQAEQKSLGAFNLMPTIKKLSSKKRYAAFNAMLRHNDHHGVYRDRCAQNGVSVKVDDGLSRIERVAARKLCDKISVSFTKSIWHYERRRVERYIFRNVLGAKRPVPCMRGQQLRWKASHNSQTKRSQFAWTAHKKTCKACQPYVKTISN